MHEIIACRGRNPDDGTDPADYATLAGWVDYFLVGNASRAFSDALDYFEMKIRTLLTWRKRRRKSSVGWRRWSNEYLYDVLGLY